MSGAFFTIGMTVSFKVRFRNNSFSRRGFQVLLPASLFLPEDALPQGEDFAAGRLAEWKRYMVHRFSPVPDTGPLIALRISVSK